MICFYHSADFDGHCSGAIVKNFFPGNKCKLYGIDYGQEFPWDQVENENVIMVDFSLQPFSDMIKLRDTCKSLIWIDHHESAIKDSENYDIEGVRDIGKAACELTWEYLHKGINVPLIVQLLGRYDVWDHEDDRTLPFQYGMKTLDTRPEICEDWDYWFDNFPNHILKKGSSILEYVEKDDEKYARGCAFETEFENYKCIVINKLFTSSKLFNSVFDEDKHDIMVTFGWRDGSWTVSLYTTKEDIDVSVIAKKMGGGGHRQAAGFQCQELPFGCEEKKSSL